MKKWILIIMLGAATMAPAQVCQWVTFPHGYSMGYCMATGKDGSIYVAGTFNLGVLTFSNASHNLINYGAEDIFLIKYSPSGNVVWSRRAGGDRYDMVYGLTLDTNDNIYMSGSFYSTLFDVADTSFPNSYNGGSYTDLFIAKFDSSGNGLWARRAGTAMTGDMGRGTAVDKAGNIYFTGLCGAPTQFGTFTANGFFLVKYDPQGQEIWVKSAPGGHGYEIAIDTAANIYAAGWFYLTPVIFGNDTLNNTATNGSADIFLVKYDSTGLVHWAKKFGGSKPDLVTSMEIDSAQNLYLSGHFLSDSIVFGADVLHNPTPTGTNYEIFLTKMTTQGQPIWAVSAGGPAQEQANGMDVTPDGTIYLSGQFKSLTANFGGIPLTNTSNVLDIFTAAYDSTGNALWAKSAGGQANDEGRDVIKANGAVYCTGWFSSSYCYFDTITVTDPAFPQANVFFAKYDLSTSVNISELPSSAGTVQAGPVPASAQLNVHAGGLLMESVELYNALGGRIYSCAAMDVQHIIPVEHLNSGVYLLRVVCGSRQLVEKVAVGH